MSVVWHFSLLLMYSFNKTEAAIFSMQAMLPKDLPFFLILRIWTDINDIGIIFSVFETLRLLV